MDLSFVKQKLADNASKGVKREKIDYSKIFWKPKPGKYQIRILPNKYRKEWPLREIQMHYGFTKGPIVALTNWGENDPIVECVKELRRSPDKDDWDLAKKLSPKVRYFAPVVVRGEESAGVRLWEVSKTINDQLMGIAADEDYGDFTNITDGRDLTVEAVEGILFNKKAIICTLRIKPKVSPISENADFVKKVLEEQTDILSINRKYTFDQLKEILQKWLNPEEDIENNIPIINSEDEDDNEDELKEEKSVSSNFKLEVKKSNKDKFDDLFSDDTDDNDDNNDLPF